MNIRLKKLRDLLVDNKIDALLVTSASNRRYITAFTGSAGYALITKDNAFLITDFRYIDQAKVQTKDFEVIKHDGLINDTLLELLIKYNVNRLGFEQDFVTFSSYQRFSEKFSKVKLIPTTQIIEKLRMIKDDDEIKLIKRATAVADEAFSYILNFIKPNIKEKDISLALEYKMRELGAEGISFTSIVASGYRSSLPHGAASDKIVKLGEFVTMDFGAIYNGYVSDMTRTVVVGQPSEKQKEIYNIVLEAQLFGVNNIKAGMTGKEADALTRDIINKYGYGEYFGHGTGHGIGLDVHEGPTVSSRSDTVLVPGMIVTIEPGIYIPDFGGVRIEDDVLITESGREVLTKSNKDLIIID